MECSGLACVVGEHLGGGSQGDVYRAHVGDAPFALKWYTRAYLAADAGVRARIAALAECGAPTERFLWPLELVSADGVPSFGYLMPLRPPNHVAMSDVIARRAEPTFRAIVTAAFELADSFLHLHAKGLAYRDISENNVFVDVETGRTAICDTDNVAPNGEPSPIAGTLRYMAPEISLGRAEASAQTDLHALAVLLFLMLMLNHPFDGALERTSPVLDRAALLRLYAEHPVFIFDPADDSNRPIPGRHDNAIVFWALYPPFVRDLFVRAFTAGVRDPGARVRESEWRTAMIRLRDSIFPCGSCGAECFASEVEPVACWSCGARPEPPLRLRFERDIVALGAQTLLFPHHLDPARRFDFSEPLASVAPHPSEPHAYGLKNLSQATWRARAGERAIELGPGHTVRIAPAVTFDFGACAADVVA